MAEQPDASVSSEVDAKCCMMDGKLVSKLLLEKIKTRIQDECLKPHLHVINVGEDPGSQVFIKQKRLRAQEVGITFSQTSLPEDTTLEALRMAITSCNVDNTIHGIIVQLPLPAALQAHESEVLKLVDAAKDVDCFHPLNYGQLSLDRPTFLPATPAGILKLIEHYGIATKGKLCVILGKSNIVGKPLGLLMANERGPAATVVLCDQFTEKARELTRQADILIVAAGKHHLINSAAWLREDKQAVVIDVGIHRVKNAEDKFVVQGDVDADAVRNHCRFLTPVPGGVGPMTVACLLDQVVQAASQLAQVGTCLERSTKATQRLSKVELQELMADIDASFPTEKLESVFSVLCADDDCVSVQAFVDWACGPGALSA